MEEVIAANPGVSLDRLRKCFNSTYRVSLSQPRFRRWFRACGFTATRQIIIKHPDQFDPRVAQDYQRLEAIKSALRDQAYEHSQTMKFPPGLKRDPVASEEFKPTIPTPMEDIPDLGGGPPEPNVLPGGVPIPVSLYK